MKEIFQRLHRYFNKNTPQLRGIYAIERGKYIGEFFVFIKILKNGDYAFLGLPKMEKRVVPIDSFHTGIKNKIIIFVQKLPKPIHKLCCKQYDKSVDKGVTINK